VLFIGGASNIFCFLLQEEFEAMEMKARRRSLGNIRFIGELYKLQMLTVR
jgi:hypothetical protein